MELELELELELEGIGVAVGRELERCEDGSILFARFNKSMLTES